MISDVLILVLLAVVTLLYFLTRLTLRRVKPIASEIGLSGQEVAEALMSHHGLEISVQTSPKPYSDHYNLKEKRIVLNEFIHDKSSIASVVTAAHEVSHALQDKEGYPFMHLREEITPIISVCYLITVVSYLLSIFLPLCMELGTATLAVLTYFYLVTIPIEWNATRRAKEIIQIKGWLTKEEQKQAFPALVLAGWFHSIVGLLSLVLLISAIIRILTHSF